MLRELSEHDVVEVLSGYSYGMFGTVLETHGEMARLEFTSNDTKHWFYQNMLRLRWRPY